MKYLVALFFIFLLQACNTNRFVSEQNYNLAKKHRTVAILPTNVITTGNLPANLSADDLRKLDSLESDYFQDVIYGAIQKKNKKNNPYWVEFLPNREVNLKLHDKKISAQNLDKYSIKELAEILEVDGVVLSEVRKKRFMSESASAAVNIGEEVLEEILDIGILLPGFSDRTYRIFLDVEVYDGKSQTLIYDRAISDDIDYTWTTDQSVAWLSRKIGKKIPYREYKK